MALIQLNRTKTGAVPTSLADGELYIDQRFNKIYWADATGRIQSFNLDGTTIADDSVTTIKIKDGAVTYPKMDPAALATPLEFIGNIISKLLPVRSVWDAAKLVTVPFSTSITLDLNTVINGVVTDTGDFTLNAPTNAKPGQTGSLVLLGTAARTMTLAAAWKTTGGIKAIPLTGVCRLDWIVVDASTIHAHIARNLS